MPPYGPKRVVGYCRVSTTEQAERGYGLEVQREHVHTFCRTEGWELVQVYEDPGVSGTTALHERPGLLAALDAVRASQHHATVPPISGLAVARFDRLARDTLQALLIEQEFVKAGARPLYADGPNGDEHQTLRELLHVMASAERRALVARLAAGRNAKAARGGYAGGRPPLGYEAVGRELCPFEPEARIVRWIYERVARDGWTTRRIATKLNEQHALGRRWDHVRVHHVLHREDYKRGPLRIVDPRVWNRASAVLAERRRG